MGGLLNPLRIVRVLLTLLVLVLLALAAAIAWEMRTSTLQSLYLPAWAQALRHEMQTGASPGNRYPRAGPFDERAGYTHIPHWTARLADRGFALTAQAHQSEALVRYLDQGFFPPYREKTQSGLDVLDCRRETVFKASFPQRAYPSFEAIPALLVHTLAHIENREVLTATEPRHNPALEWPRLGRAVLDQAIKQVDPSHPAAGGSTLATQLEKFRHSPGGRTASISDKYRQVVSASVRAYRDGGETAAARQRIVLDYLNSLPLGAQRHSGEVVGILDGLAVWYGVDPAAVNAALRSDAADPAALQAQARALRQVLSLLIAQRRPGFYLGAGQDSLKASIDAHLRVLAEAGVIAPALRDAALQAPLVVRDAAPEALAAQAGDRKAANLMRTSLAALLDTPRLYDLDRFDLGVTGTLDNKLQKAITESLRRLVEPEGARAAGLIGHQLLERGDPSKMVYSFTLYERGEGANLVRVQTDNLDQPFNLNAGAKLELGSTAKLRTLVSYLEIVAALHDQLGGLSASELAAVEVSRRDRLTRWAIDHLSTAQDRSLAAMLQAAMRRRYSAHPGETFFTGGGAHTFGNFHRDDDGKVLSVSDAFRDSVNLVFVRLMRDVVHHHMYRDPQVEQMLEDPRHPGRAALLARFADQEGSHFIRGFYTRHRGLSSDKSLDLLLAGVRPTPVRLAVIYRTWAPEAPFERFNEFLDRQPVAAGLSEPARRTLYERYATERFPLSDRGYLAGVHPLELVVAAHLARQPAATLTEVLDASRADRQEVYRWLMRTRSTQGQDTRIVSMLEGDAFAQIHRGWKRVGFPFDSLVPSYATALGSSGDRPAALAELAGILVNDGVRLPSVQVEGLHFAAGTPWETVLRRQPAAGERVLPAEVAAVARQAMARVVEEGTARRIKGALLAPDGTALVVGGKTGTGDNRLDQHGARGALIGSRAVNRTATFVFFIGDRFFGTLTAYVPGSQAQAYRFTSALPVQILKSLAPQLQTTLNAPVASACAPAQRATPEQEPPGLVMTRGRSRTEER